MVKQTITFINFITSAALFSLLSTTVNINKANQKWLGEERVYYINRLMFFIEGSWGRNSRMSLETGDKAETRTKLLADLSSTICSACLLMQPRSTCPSMALFIAICVLPHQSSIKRTFVFPPAKSMRAIPQSRFPLLKFL